MANSDARLLTRRFLDTRTAALRVAVRACGTESVLVLAEVMKLHTSTRKALGLLFSTFTQKL